MFVTPLLCNGLMSVYRPPSALIRSGVFFHISISTQHSGGANWTSAIGGPRKHARLFVKIPIQVVELFYNLNNVRCRDKQTRTSRYIKIALENIIEKPILRASGCGSLGGGREANDDSLPL